MGCNLKPPTSLDGATFFQSQTQMEPPVIPVIPVIPSSQETIRSLALWVLGVSLPRLGYGEKS